MFPQLLFLSYAVVSSVTGKEKLRTNWHNFINPTPWHCVVKNDLILVAIMTHVPADLRSIYLDSANNTIDAALELM